MIPESAKKEKRARPKGGTKEDERAKSREGIRERGRARLTESTKWCESWM